MNKIVIAVIGFIAFIGTAAAQPYLDIAKISYAHTPRKGINNKKKPLQANNYNFSLTLPIELQKGGDAILLNPFYDDNDGTVAGRSFHVVSQGLVVGFLKKSRTKEWTVLSGFFLRRNKQPGEKLPDIWQYGGAVVTTWNKTPTLAYKFGVYYNKEYFRDLIVPLLGIDWKINERDNLFGIMPGSLTYEHKVTSRFYWGSSFRAVTNGYRLPTADPCASGDCTGKNYLRVIDYQLGLFADTYLTPRIVLTGEAGYTIMRKYRFGFRGKSLHEYVDHKNDNVYLRATLGYRLRFR